MKAFNGIAGVAALIASFFCLSTIPAGASGTVVIQQKSGHVDTYKGSSIKVIHGALYVTSPDGRGTLIVHRAACSYQGELLVCFATSVTLVEAGRVRPIDLNKGTVYLNNTDKPQPLVLSSTRIPPHSLMLSLTTDVGTYVTLSGRIDSVVQ